MQYYKVARFDGFDIFTGKTINYRENIGKTVKVPNVGGNPRLCSDTVIHASCDPNDGFINAPLPCSIYEVEGEPVISDKSETIHYDEYPEKSSEIYGFKELHIIKEIPQNQTDKLLGWKYSEVCNPVHPFKIPAPEITDRHIKLLKNWISVWNSIWDENIRQTVWPTLRTNYSNPFVDSVVDSIWSNLAPSVWNLVSPSVKLSVDDALTAYFGTFFPNIKKWLYIKHKSEGYPFQSAANLWREGLVPASDGETWQLLGGPNAKILAIEKKFADTWVKF